MSDKRYGVVFFFDHMGRENTEYRTQMDLQEVHQQAEGRPGVRVEPFENAQRAYSPRL